MKALKANDMVFVDRVIKLINHEKEFHNSAD
jgi:hypothetical protein